MKAAVMRSFGAPEVLEYADVPTPTPAAHELLIKVEAAGLNRLDHYLREGSVTRDIALPHILGSDAVGTVVDIGRNVTRFEVGDRVIPMPGYPLAETDAHHRPISVAPSYAIRGIVQWGAYAEYMTVPEQWAVLDTTGMPAEAVATLPMAVVTGVRAVKVVGGLQAGETVLVHGGASGTGSINVQIAKALGARVIASVRTPEKADFVQNLGADDVVTLDDQFEQRVRDWSGGRGVDAVIDNLGGPVLTRSLDVLAPLGRLVSMGMVMGLESTIPLRPFFFTQKQIRGTLMGDVEDLNWGLGLVRDRKIRPALDRVLPLSAAAEAHRALAAGSGRGTIVLLPGQAAA